MQPGILRYIARRILFAGLLVFCSSSAAFVLARLAPGDYFTDMQMDPAFVAAERARLGLDRPLPQQYGDWLASGLRLDFGESLRFRRPVGDLIRERAGNTLLLGASALILATVAGIPLGVVSGTRRRSAAGVMAKSASLVLLSIPPLITSLVLLLIALRTGWFAIGAGHLLLPSLALALPIAAVLERLQSQAIAATLGEPSIMAAFARGIPTARVIWRHCLRLSLKPVLAIYGVIVGGVLSGSFVVEVVMSWPGLGDLMHQALLSRDLYLVSGCAAVGSLFLAAGILLSDLALLAVDPRVGEAV